MLDKTKKQQIKHTQQTNTQTANEKETLTKHEQSNTKTITKQKTILTPPPKKKRGENTRNLTSINKTRTNNRHTSITQERKNKTQTHQQQTTAKQTKQ